MAFTFLLILSLLLGGPPAPKPIPTIISQARLSLVRLTFDVIDPESGEQVARVCSGFVTSASRGEAITAAHCVPEDGGPFQIDGLDSEVIKQDMWFALVKIPVMLRPPLAISNDTPPMGAQVVSIGWGYGYVIAAVRHVAEADPRLAAELLHEPVPAGTLIVDGPLVPGMSGGPVLNEQGEVVGLNQATNEILGIVSGAEDIKAFIKKKP